MEVDFRYATPQDLERIVSTYNATIPSQLATADLEPVSVQSKQAWFEAHHPNTRPIWTVNIHNNYVGWMSFNSFYGRPAYNGTVELSIYLEESVRGKGLGKLCLQKAINEAPTRQIHTLLGFIFGHNAISLQLFYKFGFSNWGRLPQVADMNGNRRDLVIVGKKV